MLYVVKIRLWVARGLPTGGLFPILPMIKVNTFALYRYKTAGKCKLAPPYIRISRQGGAQRGGEIFLGFPAGIDHGAKV
jgi:hypothetical protein